MKVKGPLLFLCFQCTLNPLQRMYKAPGAPLVAKGRSKALPEHPVVSRTFCQSLGTLYRAVQ